MASILYDWFGKRSFGQAGEDIVAESVFGKKKKGFYVDVGAYHPKVFSNTYMFYKRGWRGIAVEPNPEMAQLFAKTRKRDVVVNMGVGEEKDVKDYYIFSDPASNTFSAKQVEINQKAAGRKLLGKKKIAVLPLREILEENVPKGVTIDVMSVDVEGMDLEVLHSNDWKKFRPKVVICEDMTFDFRDWKKSKVAVFLEGIGYRLVGVTPYSLIFAFI